MPILRDPRTCMKWCVKRSELRDRTRFPQYCAGIGYTLSSALLGLLYNASTTTPFFWIDDVYVTGLLAKKLPASVKYVDTGRHFTSKVYCCVLFSVAEWLACWTQAQKGLGSNRSRNCSHPSCLCSTSSEISSSPRKGCQGDCGPGGK